MQLPQIHVAYPSWVPDTVDFDHEYATDHDRMGLAIEMARQNVAHGTGGPFGAAIFEEDSGRLVAVGMNLVVPQNNSCLHGEVVAFMMAQARLATFSLAAPDLPRHVLATSCEPCAMCLGATLWSGVCRVICGASRDDAMRLDFDEGPVFPESYQYLEERGVAFTHGVRREEAAAVMEQYRQRGGPIYNA
jgi:tRNA(Arg) A34 adenosine deaminase TadA